MHRNWTRGRWKTKSSRKWFKQCRRNESNSIIQSSGEIIGTFTINIHA